MKVKTDFTTNSSSSSFLVAVNDTCKVEDILNILKIEENQKKIQRFIEHDLSDFEDYNDYDDGDDDLKEIFQSSDDEMEVRVDKLSKWLAEKLYHFGYGYQADLSLDGWKVSGQTVSNESGNLLSVYLYNYGIKVDDTNPYFRIGGFE